MTNRLEGFDEYFRSLANSGKKDFQLGTLHNIRKGSAQILEIFYHGDKSDLIRDVLEKYRLCYKSIKREEGKEALRDYPPPKKLGEVLCDVIPYACETAEIYDSRVVLEKYLGFTHDSSVKHQDKDEKPKKVLKVLQQAIRLFSNFENVNEEVNTLEKLYRHTHTLIWDLQKAVELSKRDIPNR